MQMMTQMTPEELKKQASLLSLGSSSDEILKAVLAHAVEHGPKNPSRIFDIGCGQGQLLELLKNHYPPAQLTGCDYTDFRSSTSNNKVPLPFHFFTHDCNQHFPSNLEKFDLIVSSEVIEHIENGRHFWRQISEKLNVGGKAVVSTPNIECLTSLLSFIIRGHHSAFGGKAYPAHINPVSLFDMKNMIQEAGLSFERVYYIPNGRLPGTSLRWSTFFGNFSHRLFADNYLVVARKK